ncbi:MAG: hypothetical protein ACYCZO_10190 [Daejeonella sp.]
MNVWIPGQARQRLGGRNDTDSKGKRSMVKKLMQNIEKNIITVHLMSMMQPPGPLPGDWKILNYYSW